MSEIPNDIREAAEKAWQPTSFECKQAIASAILGERKRCAEAVHRAAKDFYGNTDQMHAAALILSEIEADK